MSRQTTEFGSKMALQYNGFKLFRPWSSKIFRSTLVFASQCSPSLTWDQGLTSGLAVFPMLKQYPMPEKQVVGQSKPSTTTLPENNLTSFWSSLIHSSKLRGWPLGNEGPPCHLLLLTSLMDTTSLMKKLCSMQILSNERYWSAVHSFGKTIDYCSKWLS